MANKAKITAYNVAWQRQRRQKVLQSLLDAQGGLCAICDRPLVRPFIDHDHRCCPGTYWCEKCVRGALCRDCNSGIGLLQDSPTILERARVYLEKGPR